MNTLINEILALYKSLQDTQPLAKHLYELFEKFNSLQAFNLTDNEQTIINEILIYLSGICSANDDFINRITNLIIYLAEKSIIKLLNPNLNYLVGLYIDFLHDNSKNSSNRVAFYRCIGALIYKNGCYLTRQNLDRLLSEKNGILVDLNTYTDENLLIIVQCIFNLTLSSNDQNTEYIDEANRQRCLKLIIKILKTANTYSISENMYTQILVKCLKGLENLFSSLLKFTTDILSDLLAIVKNLTFYGLTLQNQSINLDQIKPLEPSTLFVGQSKLTSDCNSDFLQFNDGLVETRKKRYTKKINESRSNYNKTARPTQPTLTTAPPILKSSAKISSTSESEVSDYETNKNSKFHLEKYQSKVRMGALNVLQIAFQLLDKRTVLSYWNSFLPSTQSTKQIHLITSILNDKSPKVRLLSTQTLNQYLTVTKGLLSLANDLTTNEQHSFIPISVTIASMVNELLATLCHAIKNEPFQLNMIELFKSIETILKFIYLKNFPKGFSTKILKFLSSYLDSNMKLSALNCLNALIFNYNQNNDGKTASSGVNTELGNELNLILNANQMSLNQILNKSESELRLLIGSYTTASTEKLKPDRVTYFYNTPDGSSDVSKQSTINELSLNNEQNNSSWIIDLLLKAFTSSHQDQLKMACLSLLLNLIKFNFSLIRNSFVPIRDLVCYQLLTIDTKDDDLVISTLKFIEELSRCLATKHLRLLLINIDLNDCVLFWSHLITSTKLVSTYLIQESSYMSCSIACDCLASIGSEIFELLTQNKKIHLITCLLALTQSSSTLPRSSSVRTLGVFVTFQSLKEDVFFLNDFSQCVLRLMDDTNNLVRQKCAWSFGNLSEILVENKDKLGNMFTCEFDFNIFLKLLQKACESCSKESDKIKSYLVRTLANLLTYLPIRQYDPSVQALITQSINELLQCKKCKMLKVKWNLCHAIGVCLKNSDTLSLTTWQMSFYNTLIEFFVSSNNYKVRINACIALNQQAKREHGYNLVFHQLWSSVFEVFEKIIENDNDRGNYELHHKNMLFLQICKLLTQLTKFLKIDDLSVLQSQLKNQLCRSGQPLVELKLCKKIKYYMAGFINEILSNLNNYKHEIHLYNEALNQLNILRIKLSNELDNSYDDFLGLVSNFLKRSTLHASSSDMNEKDDMEIYHLFNNFNINQDLCESESEANPTSESSSKYNFSQTYD